MQHTGPEQHNKGASGSLPAPRHLSGSFPAKGMQGHRTLLGDRHLKHYPACAQLTALVISNHQPRALYVVKTQMQNPTAAILQATLHSSSHVGVSKRRCTQAATCKA